MKFTKINMNTWHRKDVFLHFMNDARCVFTLTVDMDVTNLVQACKREDLKFYPTYIYLVSKVVNQRDEFKMGFNENGEAGLWEYVSPSYTVFHPEDEIFTKLITDYTPDYPIFYQNVLNEMNLQADRRAFEVPYVQKNTFDVSCLPWICYKSFDLHIYDSGTYPAPVITWGRFEMKNDAVLMPLTLQIHHAAADGFHASRFFLELQNETDQFLKQL